MDTRRQRKKVQTRDMMLQTRKNADARITAEIIVHKAG